MRTSKALFGAVGLAFLVITFWPGETSSAQEAPMHSIFVAIDVKPEHREEFLKASIAVAEGTHSKEDGVFRYDMLQDVENPNRFYFYEIFRNREAAQAHWATDHFKAWRMKVMEDADMVDGPFDIIRLRPIFPGPEDLENQRPALLSR